MHGTGGYQGRSRIACEGPLHQIPFNHVNFFARSLDLNINTAGAGAFSTISGNARQMQFGFRMAVYPNTVAQASKRVMTEGEVTKCLLVLDRRERLIARLAIFVGMRPGEIFGLKWEQVKGDSAEIVQRVYKGKIDSPKTRRSVRTAAFTPKVIAEVEEWRQGSVAISSRGSAVWDWIGSTFR